MTTLELEARLDNLLSTAQTETADIDLLAPIIVADWEECPICLIPLPFDKDQLIFKLCCGKTLCSGCLYKHTQKEKAKGGTRYDYKCALCRQPMAKLHEEYPIKSLKKLMKKKNSTAFIVMAKRYREGEGVIQSDTRSLEMYTEAAKLGNAIAYYQIAKLFYEQGTVVEEDESKSLEFYKVAAKKGLPDAHKELCKYHQRMGNIRKGSVQAHHDRLFIEHMKIMACAGHQEAMNNLMANYRRNSLVSKDILNQTLRAYQASNDLMKSEDRDFALAAYTAQRQAEGR